MYVYKKKGPIREFSDDYIRQFTVGMPVDECLRICDAITKFGKSLADLNVTIDVPEDISVLGIEAGKYGDLDVSGLHLGLYADWPAAIHEGNGVATALVGADNRVVSRSVMLESVTIGALGAVMGVIVGLITAWTWIRFNFWYLIGYELEYHFAIGSALWYLVLVLVMTMLTGRVAAQGAIRQSILVGIRQE